jgi:hypothetical protein
LYLPLAGLGVWPLRPAFALPASKEHAAIKCKAVRQFDGPPDLSSVPDAKLGAPGIN